MLEVRGARHLIEEAERAASAGDLVAVDELLRAAVRIQAAELGPLHPDLAETLNNLAIVAEKMGRTDDAERFYRRASAIASASLPADHPMVTASRQNLEDFCFASGLSLDAPAVMSPSAQDTELGLDAFAREDAEGVAETRPDVRTADDVRTTDDPRTADADLTLHAPPSPRSSRPWAAPHAATQAASEPVPSAPRRASRSFAWVAIGAVVLVAAAVVAWQPWSSREPALPAAAEQLPPAAQQPVQQTAKIQPQSDTPAVVIDTPPVPATSVGGVSLATAQLCTTFSATGGSWQCTPAGDSMAPGRLVLYSRIRSARDVAIVHRWYRGETLQKSVELRIRASPTEGYRTYSRHTVDGVGDWRVEVRSANGDLLHEQRFVVR